MKRLAVIATALMLLFSCVSVNASDNATISLPIEHKIDIQTDEVFNFAIEKTSEDAPLPENTTVQIKGNGSESFQIHYDTAGRYIYTVREIEGGTKSIKYDDTVYKVIVSVTYVDDKLTPTVVLDDGEETKPDKIIFEDDSQAAATVSPKVKKEITDDKDYKDVFRFKLEAETESPVKEATAKIKGAGVTTFPNISFDKVGTYKYKVYELKDHTSKWKYDDTEYTFTVTVTEKDGKLTAKTNKDVMTFTNSPKLLRKAERLAKIVAGHSGTSKTGDTAVWLGAATMVAAGALVIMLCLGIRRKK